VRVKISRAMLERVVESTRNGGKHYIPDEQAEDAIEQRIFQVKTLIIAILGAKVIRYRKFNAILCCY